jgi:hypothetical protein
LEIGDPKLIELGPVIDISMGGLAVQYVESKSRRQESEIISVTIPSIGVTLPELQYRVVIEKVIASLPNGKQIFNRCVEFINMTSIKKLQLESFIYRHTFDSIPDRRSGKDRRDYEESHYARAHDRRTGLDRRVYVR